MNQEEKNSLAMLFPDLTENIIVGNVIDPLNLSLLPKQIDTVIHLAASTKSEETDHTTNFEGTKNLYVELRKQIQFRKFVFISSLAVFDKRPNTRKPIQNDEDVKGYSSIEYSISKLNAEIYLREVTQNDDIPLTLIRPSTVLGIGTRNNGIFDVIPKINSFFKFILELNWPGKLRLIHVDDLSKVILYYVENDQKKQFQCLNVCTQNYTFHEISKFIFSDRKISLKTINLPNFLWTTLRKICHFGMKLKKIIPHSIYTKMWQARLIIDNITFCEPGLAIKIIGTNQVIKFQSSKVCSINDA